MYQQSADAASQLTPPNQLGRNRLLTSDPDGSVRCFGAPDQPKEKVNGNSGQIGGS